MGKLNKDSSVPLYQQLIDDIKGQIRSGKLKEHDRLMTEIELSQEYDVSRITVRKAIELLVEEEILIKKQGIGTFVAEKKLLRNINGFMGFSQSCEAEGHLAGAELIQADLIDATIADIENLKLEENEKVIRIIRVRLCDGEPVILEENHFSQKYAFLLGEDLTSSIYAILQKHNIYMESGVKTIGICRANEQEKELLKVELGEPLLLIKDISYDTDGNPVHTCKGVTNPSRYKITVVV